MFYDLVTMDSPSKDYTRFGLLILTIVLLITLSSKFFSGPFKATSSTFSFTFGSPEISKIIQSNLEGKKGNFSIYIESLTNDEKYGYKANEVFPSASLYKLYLMAAVLQEVEKGGLKMDSEISVSKAHLIDTYGGVDFGYEQAPETINFTVEEALTRIGRISDNFASLMLAERMSEAPAGPNGWEKVQAMADSLGATSTTIKSPLSTTAMDTGIFFKKLYLKQVVSPQASDKIMEFLSLSKINDRIPAGVPEGIKIVHEQSSEQSSVKIVHKTGELPRLRHDAGIVFLEGHHLDSYYAEGGTIASSAYLIVLMSKDLNDENEGVETLANISKDIFEYFRNK